MIDNFNGIIYLAVFIIHFIGYGFYAYKCVFATQSFLDQNGVDKTGAIMTRFFGAFFNSFAYSTPKRKGNGIFGFHPYWNNCRLHSGDDIRNGKLWKNCICRLVCFSNAFSIRNRFCLGCCHIDVVYVDRDNN